LNFQNITNMKFQRWGYFSILVAIVALPSLFMISSCKHDSFPADQLPQLYYADVAPIFSVCIQCHGGNDRGGGLDFSSYSGLISSGAVVAGNSSKSKAYTSLISTLQIMPPNGALSTNLRTKVRVWIDQGAKEKP
jgi:hypothetical protein